METQTLRQFLKENATIPKYAFNNHSKRNLTKGEFKEKRNYWKGYKDGWSDCMYNLLMEAREVG